MKKPRTSAKSRAPKSLSRRPLSLRSRRRRRKLSPRVGLWGRLGSREGAAGPSSPRRRIRTRSLRVAPLVKPASEATTLPVAAGVQPPLGLLTTQDFVRPSEKLKSSLEGFLLDQRSEHTRTAYAKDLKRFVKYLLLRIERRGIEVLERSVLIGYKEFLVSEQLEHTTIDRHLATLKSVFAWLTEDGFFLTSPAQSVRFLSPKRLSRTQGFSDDEVIRVLRQPNLHTKSGAMHYAILTVLFYCGLRRSEVVGLRTTHLSVERGQRVLRLRGKGNKERMIPLVSRVWNALDLYSMMARRPLTGDRYLFSPLKNNRTGDLTKPLDASMIYRIVQKYAKLAGIQGRVSPHSCRATAISNARDHQAPDRAIQEFAGWSSTQMIVHYDKRRTAIEDSAAHVIDYDDSKGA